VRQNILTIPIVKHVEKRAVYLREERKKAGPLARFLTPAKHLQNLALHLCVDHRKEWSFKNHCHSQFIILRRRFRLRAGTLQRS
jgi:hypothetical protein